tara:strand:+ start:23751 stop:24077 length:327 start_codon:yes stop_codon:yes gene_type:complete
MAIEKKFKILIYPGLHTRPGAKFVQLCSKFDSDIEILFEDKVANGKSMINIMTMAAPQNAEITIKVNGSDEEILLKELTEWHTEAHKSKEDFINFPDKHEILKVFEII